MRTTDRTIALELAKPRLSLTARLDGLWSTMTSVYRVLRNRLEINRLNELDDHQLMDIGLSRRELDNALLTATLFEDPSHRLVRSARNRIRRMDPDLPGSRLD